jgi:hypothetical protein
VVSGLYFVGGAGAPSVCKGGSGLYFILELYNPPWVEETTKSRLFNTYKRGI